jgi:glyoxylase-like metal-dependent hydrolase (beta-lactamase superfamily II)
MAKAANMGSIMIGDIRVTYIPDGVRYSRPLAEYIRSTPEMWRQYSHYLNDGWLVMSLGCFLVESADQRILIDLGLGPRAENFSLRTPPAEGHMFGGALISNLARVGLAPGDIDTIVFSHLHSDHVGWVCQADGTLTFENAQYYVSEAEWRSWSNGYLSHAGGKLVGMQIDVLRSRIQIVTDGFVVGPGIQLVSTPGHTPGHSSFIVSSGRERFIALGDAVHSPIEILGPDVQFFADENSAVADRSRRWIETQLGFPDTVVGCVHFPDAVFARLSIPSEGTMLQLFPGGNL